MQTCGTKASVFSNGRWVWFDSIGEAARFEAEELQRKIEAKKQRGGTVVLVGEMIGAARSGAENTTPSQK